MAHKKCLARINRESPTIHLCDCIKDDLEELEIARDANTKLKKEIIRLKKELNNAIIVWPFDDSPKEYRKLSKNGGDEDWLALVPKKIQKQSLGGVSFLDNESFGCCHVYQYKLENGDVIYIGCHA